MKSNSLVLLFTFIAMLAPAASAPAETPVPKIKVSGTVLDTAGKPVPGATVEVFEFGRAFSRGSDELQPDQTAKTGADGNFEFKAPAGATLIFASKPGLAPAWCSSWNPTADIEEQLVLTEPGVISGIVVDDAGKPVPDAVVTISTGYSETSTGGGRRSQYLPSMPHNDMFSARTGADGRFQIQGCYTNASYDLAVKASGKALRETERQYLGPDTMRWRPGLKEVKLVMEPAGVVEGKVRVEKSGDPVADATLMLQPDRRTGIPSGQPSRTRSGPDGTFKITEVSPGSYQVYTTFKTNTAEGLVAERVRINVEGGRTTRDVEVFAVTAGFLEVTVVGKDDRAPVPDVSVNASSERYGAGDATGKNGAALLALAPGSYQVSAYRQNTRSEQVSATVEAGVTNQVQLEIEPPRLITGVVLDPEGKPAAGLQLQVVPEWRVNAGLVKTDAEGRFSFPWSPQPGGANETCCVVARDLTRNLATAQDLDEESRTLELKLQPGLSVTGRVEDTDGKPLPQATLQLFFWAGNSGFSLGNKPIPADSDGRFEVNGLPPGRRFSMSATAKGYGSQSSQIQSEEAETKMVEMETFVLNVADRQLAGQIVDAEDKPVSGAWVHMYGQGQPNGSTRSDENGLFRFDEVCEGQVQLSASAQSSYGSTRADAGDTNVVLKLGVNSYSINSAPSRPSLRGKPLPDLEATGLSGDCAPAGKPVLLCLLDIEQRPSRRVARLLSEQNDAWGQKGLTVLGLQATPATPDAVKEWKESSPVGFKFGQIVEKNDKTKWAYTVEAFPWLILADKDHTVFAEGFAFDELEAKVEEMNKTE